MTSFQGGNNSNNNNNNASSSKEEFQKYLEKAGVMDALTKVLVGLYEEPDRSQVNALEYVKKYLGAPPAVDVDGLKRENEQLKKEVEKLKRQLQLAKEVQIKAGGEVEC